MFQELGDAHARVFGYLAQQDRRNVPDCVERDRRCAAVTVPVLAMRPTLSYEREAQSLEDVLNFPRLQDGGVPHPSADSDCLSADELAFEERLAILEKQFDDLPEVALKLVQGLALAVGPRPAGDVADVHVCGGITLDDGGIGSHSAVKIRLISAKLKRPNPRLVTDGRCRSKEVCVCTHGGYDDRIS